MKAFITGITGQDGSYLTELLLRKGYEVHGMIRRSSSFNTKRIDHLYVDPHKNTKLFLHYGDLTDSSASNLVYEINPDEIYNLGAQSHVKVSFEIPEYTTETIVMGTLRLLEAAKKLDKKRKTSCHDSNPTIFPIKSVKFYQASSSEMFGNAFCSVQKECTPFNPISPYAVAKVAAFQSVVNYRNAYNLFASNGILFNHESPRRGSTFVTQKVVEGAIKILNDKQDCIYLGNLDAQRDWGHARDYVKAMWMMLQMEAPSDYVIATGKTYSVRRLCETVFSMLGPPIEWIGKGKDEVGVIHFHNRKKIVIKIDPNYFRPNELNYLCGDSSKAQEELGWKPTCGFEDTIKDMINTKRSEECQD
jgi:GDPmannose 4,6-dehydratase